MVQKKFYESVKALPSIAARWMDVPKLLIKVGNASNMGEANVASIPIAPKVLSQETCAFPTEAADDAKSKIATEVFSAKGCVASTKIFPTIIRNEGCASCLSF